MAPVRGFSRTPHWFSFAAFSAGPIAATPAEGPFAAIAGLERFATALGGVAEGRPRRSARAFLARPALTRCTVSAGLESALRTRPFAAMLEVLARTALARCTVSRGLESALRTRPLAPAFEVLARTALARCTVSRGLEPARPHALLL